MSEECEHDWKKEYYGLRCANCQLFYPDNGNYFAPLDNEFGYGEPDPYTDDEEDEEYHSDTCTCETCIQDYPERLYLLDDVETVICARCGEEYPAESKECTSCGLSRVGRFKDDDENSGVPV
jgi:hypothetical protein